MVGVTETALPWLSTMEKLVVSRSSSYRSANCGDTPLGVSAGIDTPEGLSIDGDTPEGVSPRNAIDVVANAAGLPASGYATDFAGSISFRRSAAKLFDNKPATGTFVNAGSPTYL